MDGAEPLCVHETVRLDDAAKPAYLKHREALTAILNNADGYVTIDGDPGSSPGSGERFPQGLPRRPANARPGGRAAGKAETDPLDLVRLGDERRLGRADRALLSKRLSRN